MRRRSRTRPVLRPRSDERRDERRYAEDEEGASEQDGARPPWTSAAVAAFQRVGWRLGLVILVGAALLALGIVLLAAKVSGYAGFVDSLRGAHPAWIVLCPIGEVIAYLGYVLVVRSVAGLAGGPRFGLWLTTRIVLASEGATRVLSPAGAGGIAVYYWVLRRAGIGTHEAAVRVFALSIFVFALFGAAAFGSALALVLGAGEEAPAAMTISWLAAVAAAVSLAAALVARTSRRPRPTPAGRLRRWLADVVEGLLVTSRLIVRPLEHRQAWAGNLLYWFGDMLCLWAGLKAFGAEIGVAALVLAFATGYVAIALPLPTAGIGGVDAAMTAALYWVGVPLAPALLGVFAYRFFNFLVPTLPGLAALSTLPLLRPRLQRAGEEARTGQLRRASA